MIINLPSSRVNDMKNTRTKILDVAEDLVQRVGLNAMSYKHISDSVGIRKASIHHHFPKKDDLVDGLLERCAITYGNNYQQIVDGNETAPEKLRKISSVFASGLSSKKLCLVSSISTNQNTLTNDSCNILEGTIKDTISIFAAIFEQGIEEDSLTLNGSPKENGFILFSLFVGAQTIARSHGGVQMFKKSAEVFISSIEK